MMMSKKLIQSIMSLRNIYLRFNMGRFLNYLSKWGYFTFTFQTYVWKIDFALEKIHIDATCFLHVIPAGNLAPAIRRRQPSFNYPRRRPATLLYPTLDLSSSERRRYQQRFSGISWGSCDISVFQAEFMHLCSSSLMFQA